MRNEDKFNRGTITREEAYQALHNGERVRFHFKDKSVEIDLHTGTSELRSQLSSHMELTLKDVINGVFSIIKEHHLKIEPQYFLDIIKNNKSFEIRKNDRDFKVGDELVLKEYDSKQNQFTGNQIKAEITYITDFAQQEGYVVMAINYKTNDFWKL